MRFVLAILCASLPWMACAGSLYQEASFRALVSDHKATNVGDVVTVLIYESASATSRTDTTTNKDSSISLGAFDTINSVGAGVDAESQFNGGGVETRSGKVIARVTATVVRVIDSEEFQIEGRQRISLNNEIQLISVRGRARTRDISDDNTIISSRLADSEIEFLGEGLLSHREKPGVLTRLFGLLF